MSVSSIPTDHAARIQQSRRQRLITGVCAAAASLLIVFWAPSEVFFAICLVVFGWAAYEYIELARHWAPASPLRGLLVLLPIAACTLFWALRTEATSDQLGHWLVGCGLFLVATTALLPLLGRARVEEALIASGFLAFGVPYFTLPIVSVYQLQAIDPWLLFLLLAIVWLGDTAAFYVGSRFGRHRMAPIISPKKSWEGAAAGFSIGIVATAVWSLCRLGELRPALLAVAAVTALVAQLGDLVESMIKRGVGVKDSARLLPGHGGMYDRMDAMILAAPVFLVGLWLIGIDSHVPR